MPDEEKTQPMNDKPSDEETRAYEEIRLHQRLGYMWRNPNRVGSYILNVLACTYLAADESEEAFECVTEETFKTRCILEGVDPNAVLEVIIAGVP